MACKYFDNCSGGIKLCKLREKWGSSTQGETKWVSIAGAMIIAKAAGNTEIALIT